MVCVCPWLSVFVSATVVSLTETGLNCERRQRTGGRGPQWRAGQGMAWGGGGEDVGWCTSSLRHGIRKGISSEATGGGSERRTACRVHDMTKP